MPDGPSSPAGRPPVTDTTYFEQAALWGKPPQFYQVQVLADILEILPPDVQSVLDVGCGDGFITNALPEQLRVVGVDISQQAVKHVKRETVIGSATDLPLPDRSFDMVMSNDVLEHLDDQELAKALPELARVAKNYVLLTVPNGEDLSANLTRCADCGMEHHINQHKRPFDDRAMRELAPSGFRLGELRWSGDVTRPPGDPTAYLRCRAGYYRIWPNAICPRCGSSLQSSRPADDRLLCVTDSLWAEISADYLTDVGPWNDRSEIMGLYCREDVPYVRESAEARCESASLLTVDFGNPHQVARPDFVPGGLWSKFVPPPNARQDQRGLHIPNAKSSAVVRVQLPTSACPDDQIIIEAAGTGCAWLHAVDGVALKSTTLGQLQLTGGSSRHRLHVDKPWRPNRFGLAVELHVQGTVCLRRLEYIPDESRRLSAPFISLGPGHNLVRAANGESYWSWGFLAKAPGRVPAPTLDRLSRYASEPELAEPKASDLLQLLQRDDRHGEKDERGATDSTVPDGQQEKSEATPPADPAGAAQRRRPRRYGLLGRALRRGRRELQLRLTRRPGSRVPTLPFPWMRLEPSPRPAGPSLRVLVLSHMFPHPDQPASGNFVLEQVQALRRHAGIDARMLAGRPFWMPWHDNLLALLRREIEYLRLRWQSRWWELDTVPVKYLPYRVIGKHWMSGWLYRSALLSSIESLYKWFPFDLVHAHTGYLDGGAGLAISQRFGVPLVITEHTGPFSLLMWHRIIRRWTLRSLTGASAVIAVSEAQKRNVGEHLRPSVAAAVRVLPNGVDCTLFRPSRNRRPRPESPRIVFVGYFVPIKNLPVLFEAFTRVRAELPGATLAVIGGGETPDQPQRLQKDLERMGLADSVEISGYQPRHVIARILRRQCDLLVLPSQAETFGCALIEAMASGVPVVATRCGGPEDIITSPELGELCRPGDPEDLANAILHVARRAGRYSPEAIRAQAVRRFSYRSVADRLAELYRELTDSAAHNR